MNTCRMSTWKMVGWIALVAVMAGVAANYPDIQRYIKIESM